MSDQPIKKLKEGLHKSSFKIKPILLELQNYSFFHSVQSKDDEDKNNRFIGRKSIIDRLLSFIYETEKNTGTYLVSGFRGMGKTSTVNKALSRLNSKPKFQSYVMLWFFLLPLTFFLHDVLIIFSGFINNWIVLSICFLLLLSYLGHRDPRRNHRKNSFWMKPWMKLWYGIVSLFNPKFQKHKHTFHRLIRHSILYLLAFFFFISSFYVGIFDASSTSIFEFFWFVTHVIIFWYILSDLSEESIKHLKKKKSYKYIYSLIPIFTFLPFFIVLKLYCLDGDFFYNYGSLIKCAILSIYIGAKFFFNRKKLKRKYRVTLGWVITFFDLQHYIVIKVNLGKDNLTEKDVLKYITNELYKEYKKWYYNWKSFKRIVNIALLLGVIYLGSTIIYRTFLGNEFKNFSLDQYKIAYFFPSQALLNIEDSVSLDMIESLFISDNDIDTNIVEYNKCISEFLDFELNENNNLSKIGYKGFEVKRDTIYEKHTTESYSGANKVKYHIQHQSFINKVIVKLGMFCNELDYLTLRLWYQTRGVLIGENLVIPFISKSSNGKLAKSILSKAYPKIPPLMVFVLMLIIIISYSLIPNRFLLIKTHYNLLREIKKLRKEIDASIIIEQGGSTNGVKTSFFNYLKKTSYGPLESKDITQRLIHILDDVAHISSIFTKVRLIFVFDELDKINSNDNTVISNLEDEFDNDNNEVRYQARRKERIGRILSSMKHFLNSAHAKFIFIAGREMYDAALAGISDRESSLDTIFNDNKIYVNSFYTEGGDKGLKDISSTSEQYLCQFLIPSYYLSKKEDIASIELYNDYLKKVLKKDASERVKIISTLKDFVVYLTYRSNGAPRKLSSLIEQYIKPVSRTDITGDEEGRNIIVGSNDENLFLELGFYNQYKFNFISYLTSPIFLGIGNDIHEYSDKLLVSVSYMLDHLFKHHKLGLSYRSLSVTPEIVDINKEPQFREFLDKLIGYLSKSHLRPILSGIYDYKFHGKIQAEIKFLSKINEQEAAAFNFTLDESIELKRHFNRRLESLKKKEAEIIINNKDGYLEDYVNNISMLHMMIGDLHFYDEEFHEAIVHYMDAIQVLRQKDIKEMTLYEFVVLVRNNLKLGLAFEKNKMYDSALMAFSELTDLILRKRNMPLEKLGLARFIVKASDVKKAALKDYKENLEVIFENPEVKEINVIGRLKEKVVKTFITEDDNVVKNRWEMLYPLKDMAMCYGINSADMIKEMESGECDFRLLKTFYMQSTGESIRVLYQPLISKLHLIEKSSPGRLKSIDLIRAMKEFDFLKFPLKTDEKRVIVSEFYNKMGDLLYFKNGTLNRCLKNKLIDNIDEDSKDEDLIAMSKLLLKTPLDASFFYIKSLAILLNPIKTTCKNDDKIKVIDLIKYYEGSKDISSFHKFFCNIKSNLDAILNKIDKIIYKDSFRERYTNDFLFSIANGILDLTESLFSYIAFGELNEEEKKLAAITPLNPKHIGGFLNLKIHELLNMYHYASVIFEKIGEYRLARSQKIKILFVLNQCSTENCENLMTEKLSLFNRNGKSIKLEGFIKECYELSDAAINNSGFLDDNKMHRLLNLNSGDKSIDDTSTSNSNMEYFEPKMIYWHLVKKFLDLKETKKDKKEIFTFFFKEEEKTLKRELGSFIKEKITPNISVGGKNNRLLMLSTLVQYNKGRIEELKTIFKTPTEDITLSKEFIILNSIGACNEIIKTHNMFSLNYVTTSNLEFAKAHYQMAYWCSQLKKLEKEIEKKIVDKLKDVLKQELLDSKTTDYIDEEYHYRLALEYNNRIIDFHSRGTALQDFLRPYSYLDDFYNDNFVHFSISIERNKYQEGIIDKRIISIKSEIEKIKAAKENKPE